jgi:peptidoglycan hydrolase CwlO-like protein
MKKTLLIIGLLLVGLSMYSQTLTTIMKIDTVILEEFKTTDEAGTAITSYRRLTNEQARAYIEKIKGYNDDKADQLEMVNMEIDILNDRLKSAKSEKDRLQMEIQDNKRRIEEYKNIINR